MHEGRSVIDKASGLRCITGSFGRLYLADTAPPVREAHRAGRERHSATVRPFCNHVTKRDGNHAAILALPGGMIRWDGGHPAVRAFHRLMAVRNVHRNTILPTNQHA
jgi:hypothetical protein